MERPKVPELVVAALAVALLVGSVVGLTRSRDTAVPAASPGGTDVDIVDFVFTPKALTVSVGDTVTFTNADNAVHTATGRGTDVVDSPDIRTDETYEVTLAEAGSYEYFCKFHPFMTGTITVEG